MIGHWSFSGSSLEDVRESTGFDYDVAPQGDQTRPPSEEELALLRGPVAALVAPDYPDFAKRVWGIH